MCLIAPQKKRQKRFCSHLQKSCVVCAYFDPSCIASMRICILVCEKAFILCVFDVAMPFSSQRRTMHSTSICNESLRQNSRRRCVRAIVALQRRTTLELDESIDRTLPSSRKKMHDEEQMRARQANTSRTVWT